MFIRFFARIAMLSIACAALSHAATVNIGLITFNNTGNSSAFTIFNIYNYTNLIGDAEFPVLSTVNFLSTSLEVEHQGQPSGEAVTVPTPMTPIFGAYPSNVIPMSYVITRAIFRATLDPTTPWNLYMGGIFMPPSNQLEIVLLPSNGISMRPDQESWYIQVSNDDSLHMPEPATFLISGTSLIGLALYRRRRRA